MRTTVTIDDHLLSEAKQVAARSNRSLSSVVEDALRRLLAQTDPPADAGHVRLPSHGEGGLRPGVDLYDKQAMAELLGEEAPIAHP